MNSSSHVCGPGTYAYSLSSIRSALIITKLEEKFRTQASRTNPPLFPKPNQSSTQIRQAQLLTQPLM